MRRIDVRDLLDHPGSAKTVRVREPAAGLHLELAGVRDDASLGGDLLLESVVEGILVSGALTGRMWLRCARCLAESDRDFEVQVSELFVHEPDPDGDDYELSPEGDLDPEPMVRDAVILAIPFSPLCRPDCLGICERCGGDRNLGQCACRPQPADPRWAGLERLLR